MQHDHVLAFDILTGPPALREGGGESAGKIFATMLLQFAIPFNLTY